MSSHKNVKASAAPAPGSILEVAWESGIERLDLPAILDSLASGQPGEVETIELRKENSSFVKYTPILAKMEEGVFTLTYVDGGTWLADGEEGGDAQGDLGTATYRQSAGTWRCEWTYKAGSTVSVEPTCTLFDPEAKETRLFKAYRRAIRDPAFRNTIFGDNPSCAITGETCRTVLDAAHILGVGHGGTDQLANGIVLRRDLHALFDANLLRLDSDGVFSIDPDLAAYGKILIEGKSKLNPAQTVMLRENIKKRNKKFDQ
jgi:hypothetical protein